MGHGQPAILGVNQRLQYLVTPSLFDPRFHPRRWMMFPEGHGLHPGHTKLRGRVRFFNRDTGAFATIHLPLFKDHAALDDPDSLLLLQRDADTAICLLNPFTGDFVHLPPLRSLLPQLYRQTPYYTRLGDKHNLAYLRGICAAVSVTPVTGTITVIVALEHLCRFAHASTGDRSWTLASWKVVDGTGRSLAFHGSLYMVYHGGSKDLSIMRLDPPLLDESWPEPQTIAKFPRKLMTVPQLVDCDDEILVVGGTVVVTRLADLLLHGRRPVVPLTNIGDHCLFFGRRSLAVSCKGLPSVAGNCIILCDSFEDDLRQYHLGDDTLSPACDGHIGRTPPPSPHSIIHHLVTCSYRYFWNKGLIYCTLTDPTWRTKRKCRLGLELI
jgi:hypothetical protein